MSNTEQVNLLASEINQFLRNQSQDWDVLVIGHSRGGIFSHELAPKIIRNSRLNHLYTVLLDATASVTLADRYPFEKTVLPDKKHTAFNYYDNRPFFDLNLHQYFIVTESDQDIFGYQNIRQDYGHETDTASHGNYAWDFVNHGDLDDILRLIRSNQTRGNFPDQYSTYQVVNISAPKEFVWADVYVSENDFFAELSIGQLTSNVVLHVGSDRTQIAVGAIIMAGNLAIDGNKASISASVVGAGNVGVDIGSEGISSDIQIVDSSGISAEISRDEVVVSGSIGNNNLTIGSSGTSATLFGRKIIGFSF